MAAPAFEEGAALSASAKVGMACGLVVRGGARGRAFERRHGRCKKSSGKRLTVEGDEAMKAVVNSFMQLLAIIMSLVTLAVSTAAVSMFLD